MNIASINRTGQTLALLGGVGVAGYAIYKVFGGISSATDAAKNAADAGSDIVYNSLRDAAAYYKGGDTPAKVSKKGEQTIDLLRERFGPNALDKLTGPNGQWDQEVAQQYRAYLRTQGYSFPAPNQNASGGGGQ